MRPLIDEQFNEKAMVSATSPALLLLCGDMRCYCLLETPLEAHLRVSALPQTPSVDDGGVVSVLWRWVSKGIECFLTLFHVVEAGQSVLVHDQIIHY